MNKHALLYICAIGVPKLDSFTNCRCMAVAMAIFRTTMSEIKLMFGMARERPGGDIIWCTLGRMHRKLFGRDTLAVENMRANMRGCSGRCRANTLENVVSPLSPAQSSGTGTVSVCDPRAPRKSGRGDGAGRFVDGAVALVGPNADS